MPSMRCAAQVGAVVLVGFAVAGCGAPGPVEQAFAQRYPGWSVTSWERQPYGWEAAFGGDDGAFEAEFDDAGRWLETEVEVVDGAGFPVPAREALRVATGGRPVSKWEIEVTPLGEFYEVETVGSDGEHYVDAAGRAVRNQFEDA